MSTETIAGPAAGFRDFRGQLVWIAVSTLALFTVSLINGYPLVFPDTGTYLAQAIELESAIDRPPFYSILLFGLHLKQSLWPVPLAQCLLTCLVLFRTVPLAFPLIGNARIALGIVLAGLLTSLPWFANQIMPDIFSPLLVMLIFALTTAWDRLEKWERIGIPLLFLPLISSHSANVLFSVALLVAALALAWLHGADGRSLRRGAALVLGPVLLALAAQSFYSYVVIQKATPSPYGSVFLLARLLEDGPARDYLREHCGEKQFLLCKYQDQIPQDHNDFLWEPTSPIRVMHRELDMRGTVDEAGEIVAGTVRSAPLEVAGHLLRNGFLQNFNAKTTDVDCPCIGGTAERMVNDYFPREIGQYRASLQNTGRVPWPVLATVDDIVLVLAAVLLVIVAVRQWRSPSPAQRLLLLILFAYVANAFLMGGLSGIADRYAARIAWLLPLFAFLYLLAPRTNAR